MYGEIFSERYSTDAGFEERILDAENAAAEVADWDEVDEAAARERDRFIRDYESGPR